MDYIRLKNMCFYAYHGLNAGERSAGQRFEVDVEFGCNLEQAGKSNDLKDTYDYGEILKVVSEVVTETRFNLIEALAQEIAARLLKVYPDVRVKVVVRKPKVPIQGILDYAEVEIERGPVN